MRNFHNQCSDESSIASPVTTDDGIGEEELEIHDATAEVENPTRTWGNENNIELEEEIVSWLPGTNNEPMTADSASTENDGLKTNKRHRSQSMEPVIVPRRRLTTAPAKTSTKASCGRWALGGFPARETMAIEMTKGFRQPASRTEPATRDRILGGVSDTLCSLSEEEITRPRTTREGDQSRERLFGASEELLRQGVKEWPIKTYRPPCHRPRPGDDSRKQICWWLESPDESSKETHKTRQKYSSASGLSTSDRVFGTGSDEGQIIAPSPVPSRLSLLSQDECPVTRSPHMPKIKTSRNPISGEGVVIPTTCNRSKKTSVHRNPISGDGIVDGQIPLRNAKQNNVRTVHPIFGFNATEKPTKSIPSIVEKRNPIIGEGCNTKTSQLKTTSKRPDSRVNPITGEPL